MSNYCLPNHPEIFVVFNIIEDGKHIGAFEGRSDIILIFHKAMSPVSDLSSHCVECPEGEGETCFTSMFAVYEALPDERKQWLLKRRGVHDYVWNCENHHNDRPPLTEEQKAATPPLSHLQ